MNPSERAMAKLAGRAATIRRLAERIKVAEDLLALAKDLLDQQTADGMGASEITEGDTER